MKELRKRLWVEVALCASFLPLLYSSVAFSAILEDKTIAANVRSKVNVEEDTYTVNFNNIAITEFIRFASKITGLNFVFEESDLQFTVTVISEESITAKNVMAALAQVLRMHEFSLIEQDGNVLITKSRNVNAIAPLISADLPEAKEGNAALVTRVFRIKNANVNTIANIIRPMTSQGALIEVSVETKQLIVTDITANVDQIASLLISLDTPHTSLEVDSYVVKNVTPKNLIPLTEQILSPFTEGNPLIFVPQEETNSIFIVSTPYLIERAIAIMEDLDIPPKTAVIGQGMVGKNVFLYKPIYHTVADLYDELMQIASQMKQLGGPPSSLEIALTGVQLVKDSGILMFVADPETTTKIKDILSSIDTPSLVKTSFWIYKIQRAQEVQIAQSLKQMKDRLMESPHPDHDLIDAIDSMKWIKETNSLVFTGSEGTLKKLADIVPTFDVSPQHARTATQAQAKSNFLIYNPQFRSGKDLQSSIEETALNLQEAGLADPSFMQAIHSVRWVPNTHSLIFTGDPQSLERIQVILKEMDTQIPSISKTSEIFVYKPQYVSSDQVKNALDHLIPALKKTDLASDHNLIQAIQSMQWHSDTQTFTVSSDPATIARLKELIASFDTPQQVTGILAKGFFLYKLQHAHCDKVLMELKNVASKLPSNSLQNQNLIAAINRTECIPSSNSLLISGTEEVIEKIKSLIAEFDIAPEVIAPLGVQSFLIYKAKYLPANEIELALNSLASDLEAAGLHDPPLFQSIASMRYVQATDSLVFTGNQETLDKIQMIINGIDTSAVLGAIQRIGNLTFLLYRIQTAAPDKLLTSLKSFAENLKQSNIQDKELAQAIESAKYIRETNTLLFTGTNEALIRLEQVLKNFDLPALAGPIPMERAAATFVIYNPKYLTGEELISILCDFMDNLMHAGVSDPGLFDAISNLKWIPKTSTLLISGDPASIERVQQLLVKFDLPGKDTPAPSIEFIDNISFLVYKLQYHPGNDIQTALRQVAESLTRGATPPTALVEAIHSLQWVQVTNSLLCTGQQDVLIKLKDLIQNLDVPLRQVFIEVLVIQTDLTNTQQFGLQWGGQAQYFNKATMGTGSFPASASQGSSAPVTTFAPTLQGINATTTPKGGDVPFTTGFDLGVIGDVIMNKGKSFVSLGALVNAIQLDNDSTILLNPKIITQDNRQSTIFVGQNIPYTGAIVTNTASNTTSTANIEYRDVGMSLTITPILGDGDIITLDIVQDISQLVSGESQTSTTVLTGIQTTHTHMETRVHVPNNFFVALSGMINDSKTHFRTSVPCLGGLPVIGLFFSENDRTAVKDNVIIFIRPQIINTYEDYKKITEHQEWLYKDNARLPMLKEEFDEGVDLVKLPQNE